jgi:hypothetical protein
MQHIDPWLVGAGSGLLVSALVSAGVWAWRMISRVAALEARTLSLRLELNNMRMAVTPQRLGPMGLQPPPLPEQHPFWTRAVTICAPEHHSPRDFYPRSP